MLLLLSLIQVASASLATVNRGFAQKAQFGIKEYGPQPNTEVANQASLFTAYNLSVPIDHFQNESRYEPHSNDTFALRYWFDASHYKGGPVFLLEGGEDAGEDRLPYLQKGLIAQLAQITNGIAVVLEHRYYGGSVPTVDFSTENLRFLSTEQGLADVAFFAQNIVYPGLEDQSLTSEDVPYIVYGGSYAGAMSAFLRVTYPDIFFGAIASSAVTEAIIDYWQYYEAIRLHAPQDCVQTIQNVTGVLDNLISNATAVQELETLFGLEGISHVTDFANVLSYPLAGWQNRNWDPAVNDPSFFEFCDSVTVSTSLLYNNTVTSDEISKARELISTSGVVEGKDAVNSLATQLLNYVGYLNDSVILPCMAGGQSADSCFGSYDPSSYEADDLAQEWRLWEYQVCTEWGFFATGSGTPTGQPAMVSRSIDVEYLSLACVYAFNITSPPDVSRIVDKYGGFGIEYPRLAFIGGQADPWGDATPFSDAAGAAAEKAKRTNTLTTPFWLIQDAVHHWDENGVFPNETTPTVPPEPVKYAQQYEHEFIQAWLKEYKGGSSAKKTPGQKPLV